MAEPDEIEDDLFADLYEGDDSAPAPAASASAATAEPVAAPTEPEPAQLQPPPAPEPIADGSNAGTYSNQGGYDNGGYDADQAMNGGQDMQSMQNHGDHNQMNNFGGPQQSEEEHRPIGIKEDGKMFIGGLNWETTDQSLKDYFSQFGEVVECTVMRDGASGRSRGFGFLTFKDPKCVNTVMVKEHYLDGKIIDPKRAIPRDEQERTSKIFVGGVSQEATEQDFKSFFMQFGRVLDATLMMDKDTGRPRGFGFVTFDSEAAVERTLERPLEILGKMIEVKKAQPRGNLKDDNNDKGRFNRHGGGRNDRFGGDGGGSGFGQNQAPQDQMGGNGQMSQSMMAQYWNRMQQYFQMMQQKLATGGGGGGMPGMPMGNPAMMQQMMAMQGAMGGGQEMPGMPNQMNPAMMQQMQQMQQMQAMQQGGYPGIPNTGGMTSPTGSQMGANRPAYNAQEQLAFEQQKYERQQQQQRGGFTGQQGGGPTSWEGMYDDVPAPAGMGGPAGPAGNGNFAGGFRGGRGGARGGRGSQGPTPQPAGQAPANAPTGPKNAGKPGANYRGGGRGGHRGFHPYARGGA